MTQHDNNNNNNNNTMMSLTERLGALNDGPIFLPTEMIWNIIIPQIGMIYLALSMLYVGFLFLLDYYYNHHHHNNKKDDTSKSSSITTTTTTIPLSVLRKRSYTATNLVANFVLTVLGFYYESQYIWGTVVSEENKVQGYESMIVLSCFQLGFQCWAIPVGIWYVNESSAMIAHHITVIAVASMSGFFRNGFRYWTPFFYGMIELSSIPLSLMNFFKEHPTWIAQYPATYDMIRLTFAGTFFMVRIVLFVPRMLWYLRDHFVLYSQHPNLVYRCFMAMCGASSFFLLLLQIYWATLILKGLIKNLMPKKTKTM